MRVLAIEPYYGLSHRVFLDGWMKYSRHDVELWTQSPRKWKWRMRGSAYHFAERASSEAAFEATAEGTSETTAKRVPDLIFASDFLNVADWRALSPPEYRSVPISLYFHENQACYPTGAAPQDFHYSWINLSSALAADDVLFNSSYHRDVFLPEVARVLKRMPDYVPEDLPGRIRARSQVFPVGIDFEAHESVSRGDREFPEVPRILWNHRWEYDKDPETFVDGLIEVAAKGRDFRLAICGESFGEVPPPFARLKSELGDRIDHFGFAESRSEYLRIVADSDVVVSTARHEFFGVSVVEAIYLGCLPILPHDLSYPEIVPEVHHSSLLYERGKFARFLDAFLRRPPVGTLGDLRRSVESYDWRSLAPRLDDHLEAVAQRGPGPGIGTS